MNQARMDVRIAMGTVDDETKAQFYSATLGFYKVGQLHLALSIRRVTDEHFDSHSYGIVSERQKRWFLL